MLIALGALWGGMLVLGRIATAHGVSPLAFSFWNAIGGAVAIGAIARLRGIPLVLNPCYLRYYLIAGLVSSAVPNSLAFLVVDPLGAGITGILYALSPFFTYAFAMSLSLERFDRMRSLGLAAGLTGTILILLPKTTTPDDTMLHWLLIGLSMPVVLAAGNIFRSSAWPDGAHSLTLATGMLAAAALMLLPVLLVTDSFYIPLPIAHDGDMATLAVLAVSALIYLLYFEVLRLGGPVFFSQVSYVIAAASMILGIVIFDERHALWVWLAVAMIFAGILLVNKRR